MTPECPVVAEMRRARVAARNRPVTLYPKPAQQSAFEDRPPQPDFRSSPGLEDWRKQQRQNRIATVVLWVALLAMIALIGGAAIAVSSGALE